ncbi:MAG: FHA domain-containing protein [Chthonomonas sp.]|nr:FHA domain-containing protein [Chthonomonas sp.]
MRKPLATYTVGLILTMLLTASSWGQVKLTFETESERRIWVSSPEPDQKELGVLSKAKDYTVPVDDLAKGTVIKVLDVESNNVAVKSVKDAGANWAVKATDFTRLGKVQVVSFDESQHPLAVTANLKFGSEAVTLILDNSGAGAKVFGAPAGKVIATCSYLDGDQTKAGPTVTYDFQTKRAMKEMVVGLIIAGKPVQPVAAKKAEAAKPKSENGAEPKAEPTSTSSTNPLTYLIVLAVGAGLVYAIFKFLPQKRQLIEDQLAKVGVKLPTDEPPATDPVPVAPKSAPVEKILLDPAFEPDPVVSAASAVKNPRLVADDGSILLLTEGSIVVGREEAPDVTQIADQTLSRRHAEFQRSGDQVTIRDVGSTNGTYRNNQKLGDSPVALVPGDTIQFGAVRYRYEV